MDFHGARRTNQTHESKTDPEAKLARKSKGKEAKPSYSGNLLVENRNGLIMSSTVWEATKVSIRRTLSPSADNLRATPHVAQNLGRRGGSAIDRPTTGQAGYFIS